jgi:hypothetical protein
MTDTAAGQRAAGVTGRISAWIARLQQQLSDRLHANGDALARQRGWTITTTTGRLGFGGRVYRDPRFDQLAADPSRRAARAEHGMAAVTTHRLWIERSDSWIAFAERPRRPGGGHSRAAGA